MRMRLFVSGALLLALLTATQADARGLFRRCQTCGSASGAPKGAAPAAPGAAPVNPPVRASEPIGPPARNVVPVAPPFNIPAAANPEIQARLKAWDAGTQPGGKPVRVTIQIDGKDVVLEIRVIGPNSPGKPPVVTPATDTFAKALKDAFAKDAAADPAKAISQLAQLYDPLLVNYLANGDHTLTGTLKNRDQFLDTRSDAKLLKETNNAIKTFLDDQFRDITMTATLTPAMLTRVSAAFKTVAATVKGLR